MADPEILTVDPVEAIGHFRRKGLHVAFDWRDTDAAQHLKSLTVAKAMDVDILNDIRIAVQEVLEFGTTFEKFMDDLEPLLRRKGWWGKQEVVDPLTGERILAQLGSPYRLRTIFDVNLRTAYAHGQWQKIERMAEARPYLRYVGVLDKRIRPDHRAWHGTVLRWDHPWWLTHFPPNGWRCRCTVQQLSEDDLEDFGYEVSAQAPDNGTREWVNRRTGKIQRVPNGIDPGWAHNVGLRDQGIESRTLIREKALDAPSAVRETIDTSLDGLIGAGREARNQIENRIGSPAAPDIPDRFRREVRNRLQSERGAGKVSSNIGAGRGGGVTAKRVREAARDLPESWVRAGNRMPVNGILGSSWGFYRWSSSPDRPGELSVSRDAGNPLHEYTHHLQRAMPEVDALFHQLHRHRNFNETRVVVGGGPRELGRQDGEP